MTDWGLRYDPNLEPMLVELHEATSRQDQDCNQNECMQGRAAPCNECLKGRAAPWMNLFSMFLLPSAVQRPMAHGDHGRRHTGTSGKKEAEPSFEDQSWSLACSIQPENMTNQPPAGHDPYDGAASKLANAARMVLLARSIGVSNDTA